ncbi:hypothetical protein EV426DRAFT_642336 [Tirmania nivea]|nr:hypothetical protein EV426DRAFT_642336 [Tirmania nivea]
MVHKKWAQKCEQLEAWHHVKSNNMMPSAWVMETSPRRGNLSQDGGTEEEDNFDVEVVFESSSDDLASISESPVSSASVMASGSTSLSVIYLLFSLSSSMPAKNQVISTALSMTSIQVYTSARRVSYRITKYPHDLGMTTYT